MYQLVGRGDASNISQLESFQKHFPEGSEGYLDINLRSQVAADIVGWLDSKLDAMGVPRNMVTTEGRHVYIRFKTEIAPLVLIAAAIAASIFLVSLIVGWQLYKMVPEIAVGVSTTAILLIVGGILLVLFLIATRGRMGIGPVQIGGS